MYGCPDIWLNQFESWLCRHSPLLLLLLFFSLWRGLLARMDRVDVTCCVCFALYVSAWKSRCHISSLRSLMEQSKSRRLALCQVSEALQCVFFHVYVVCTFVCACMFILCVLVCLRACMCLCMNSVTFMQITIELQ